MTKPMPNEYGVFEIDLSLKKVLKNGRPVKWGDKPEQLFILLLQRAPETISKEDIFATVWEGRMVCENTLYKAISKLRKELRQQDIEIDSVFGEGYRLIFSTQNKKTKQSNQRWWLSLKPLSAVLALVVVVIALLSLVRHLSQRDEEDLLNQMSELQRVLSITKQAFISQIARRNELGEMLSQRFELSKDHSWEKRFYLLYDQMNEKERFLCQQIRAYTEGPLFENNQKALTILLNNPEIQQYIPVAQEVVNHLIIWLNKYERVFVGSEKMCLLYVGVEDNARFPSEFDGLLNEWLEMNKP